MSAQFIDQTGHSRAENNGGLLALITGLIDNERACATSRTIAGDETGNDCVRLRR